MPFEAISTPEDILQLQNTVENIYVSNILQRRRLAIGEALREAARRKIPVARLHTLIDVTVAASHGLDFIWQQGMYAGIQHCTKELEVQREKGTNFSLSYGLNEIVEFAKRRSKEEKRAEKLQREINSIDQAIERQSAALRQNNDANDIMVAARYGKDLGSITDQDREDWRQETFNELQENIAKRERLLGEAHAAASGAKEEATKKRKNPILKEIADEPEETNTAEDEATKARRKKEAQLRSAWQRRKKTVDKLGDLKSRQEEEARTRKPVDSIEEKAMLRLGITTQSEINKNLSNRYTALAPGSVFAEKYLSKRQEVVAKTQNQIVQDDVQKKVAAYVKEYKTQVSQEKLLRDLTDMYRGKNTNQYTNQINNLESKRKRLRDSNLLDSQEVNKLEVDLADVEEQLAENLDIAKQERDAGGISDETKDFIANLRKQRNNLRSEIRDLSKRRVREEGRLESSIAKDQIRSEDLQSQISGLEKLLGSSDRKIVQSIFPDEEVNDSTIKEAKKLLRKRLRDTKSTATRFDKILQDKQRKLDQGDFEVSRTRGKTTRLNEEEQQEIAKLLSLGPEETAKLNKEFTSEGLRKLADRLRRRKDVFSDEKAAEAATRLAVTEVSAAYNVGRLEIFAREGVKYVQWISTMDPVTSVFCKSLHRKVFLLEDVLAQTQYAKRFPKTRKSADDPENLRINPGGIWVPPQHPNCRSYFQPIYRKEDEDKVKQDIKDEQLLKDLIAESELDKNPQQVIRKKKEAKDRIIGVKKNKTQLASRLFNQGLKFLLRRLREDGVAEFKPEEVKQNDSQLVAALIGGAAALSTSSLIYFFLKSNLASAVTDYAQTIMSDVYEGGKEFLTGMTKAQAAKVASEIAQEIKALPPSVLEELKMPFDPEKLKVPESEIEKLAKRGEAGFALAMEGIPLDEAAESLLTNSQLKVDSGKAFKNKIYKEVLNKTSSEIADLRLQGMQALTDGLGDLGYMRAIDDIRDIRVSPLGINQPVQTVNVIFKKGKGGAPFVSPRGFQTALEKRNFANQLDELGGRARQIEKVLQDIDNNLTDADPLLRGRIRLELEKVKFLARLNSKLQPLKAAPLIAGTPSVADDIFEVDIVRNRLLEEFSVGTKTLSEKANDIMKEVAENLPPSLVLDVVPENIQDLAQLESIENVLDAAIKNIKSKYLVSKKDGFKVRKLEDLVDVGGTLARLKDTQDRLANTAIQLDTNSTLGRINEVIETQISSDYNKLLRQREEVAKRIKELKND